VKPYAGAVTLFRPKPAVFYRLSGGRCLKENRDILLSDNGWSEHVAQFSVSEVPGDHDSMVLDPYVRVLAERMRALVAEGIKKREPQDADPAQPGRRKPYLLEAVVELA
jgi:thioesterase domain-containing protein